MGIIARWTTPSITYKPSAVGIADVDNIFLYLKKNDEDIIFEKSKDDAILSERGFTWFLEQTDTAKLPARRNSYIQIDYTSGTARYTTGLIPYAVTNSGSNKEIKCL